MAKRLPKKQPVNYFDPQTVLYLTGDENYSHVHLMNGTVVVAARTLKWFEEQWPVFLRPHKRSLINPVYVLELLIASTLSSPSYVVMQDQVQLPISRRRVSGIVYHLKKKSTPLK
ncbi:LytTR family transcriptional regulator [Spirosoma sp. HMF4905]|uniref:LytTR family transcriptional regulator n=1 Tax=Spirosoma arboris TaxID=2682092 RepID=A0A7K1SQW2_9BACT|nr:LytTR family DNA-binding domain-containing protein [Spirosoma arboris]MVM36194.1 LytTR family transcriptional regulator [Spirosoma arboris]